MGNCPMWVDSLSYGLSSLLRRFSPVLLTLMLNFELTPDGMLYVPISENESHPWRKLNLSLPLNALLVMDKYHIASSRLVFPSPFPPLIQLIFGEKLSSCNSMFLKS